jgi:protein SCO1/2
MGITLSSGKHGLRMKSKGLVLGVGAGALLLLVFMGWRMLAAPYTYQGSLLETPVPASDIELNDQHGSLFRLSDQRGKVVLMAFGYTNCPDVCPTTLAQFKQIKSSLGSAADSVRFVFITVDPERDTRERLNQYLGSFDPDFTGLSSSRSDLEPIWQKYGVFQQKQTPDSSGNYTVDHTSRIYAIDKNGNYRLTYPYDIDASAIAEDVHQLVEEGLQ